MPELVIIHSDGSRLICLYDEEDKARVELYNWKVNADGYVYASIRGRIVLMHRYLMNVLDNPLVLVDHKFHNQLDNRKMMLRIVTPSQNRQNSRKEKNCSSIYKGSYYETDRGLYHSQIGFVTDNGIKVFNLGRYSDERLAGKAYDRKALEIFGEFACLNFTSSKEAQQLTFPWV